VILYFFEWFDGEYHKGDYKFYLGVDVIKNDILKSRLDFFGHVIRMRKEIIVPFYLLHSPPASHFKALQILNSPTLLVSRSLSRMNAIAKYNT
jgi:hypothetical protein